MLGQNSKNVRHKDQTAVLVTVAGQEPFEGVVFLSIGDRLIDLLNDDRAFIPIKKEDGPVTIVSKSQIASIVELDVEEAIEEPEDEEIKEGTKEDASPSAPTRKRKFDPYATLRISPDASVEEIRSAYKTRVKAVHPDSIAALGLDDDLADAALKSTQKINYAYRKIMRERERAEAEGAETPEAAAG